MMAVVALCLLFTACGSNEMLSKAEENTRLFLDNMVIQNTDAMFDLLYPDVTTREAFNELSVQMQEYCPLPEEYELKRDSLKVNSFLGTKGKSGSVELEYTLTFQDREFHLVIVYQSSSDMQGFKRFVFYNEEDYKKLQDQIQEK